MVKTHDMVESNFLYNLWSIVFINKGQNQFSMVLN